VPFDGRRYPGVEGKTVEFIETCSEERFIYVRIRFTDETAVTLVLTSDVILHHVALYDESTGNLEVLKQYVKSDRVR